MPLIRCGHCHGSHRTKEVVQACGVKTRLRQGAVQKGQQAVRQVAVPSARVPDGYYYMADQFDEIMVRVRTVTGGRWDGASFLDIEKDGEWDAVNNPATRAQMYTHVIAYGAARAMLSYGEQTGYCGVCDEPLDESSTFKTHPECFHTTGLKI